MSEVLRFRVEKLIRDGLPSMMRAQGLAVFERRLADEEFVVELKRKLLEEAAEAEAADGPALVEELADVLEVLIALAGTAGASLADIDEVRLTKRRERGGFDGRTYNAAVEAPEGLPAADYYLSRPDHYPLIPR